MKQIAKTLGHGVEFGCIFVSIVGIICYNDAYWTTIWLSIALILSAYYFFAGEGDES